MSVLPQYKFDLFAFFFIGHGTGKGPGYLLGKEREMPVNVRLNRKINFITRQKRKSQLNPK
jgi:hypothetical protein